MSNLLLTKKGMDLYLRWFTRQSTPGASRQLMLFQNNLTPGPPVTLASLTEATFPGYGRFTFTASYGPAVDDGTYLSCKAQFHIFACTTTPGSAQTIYGYGVLHNNTDLIWVERFATPHIINAAGQAIGLQHYDRFTGNTSGGVGNPAVPTISGLTDDVLLGTSGGISDTGFNAGLFVNSPALSRGSLYVDFTEPAYTGYGQQSAGTFQAPTDQSAGSLYEYQTIAPYLVFQPASGWSGSETINGYFVRGNSTGEVKWAQYFSPVTFTNDSDFLYLVPSLQLQSVYII